MPSLGYPKTMIVVRNVLNLVLGRLADINTGMGSILGLMTGTGMREWRNLWSANWYVRKYGMLECGNSGGCAGLGNLYIFTVGVVVMCDDSNWNVVRANFGFQWC